MYSRKLHKNSRNLEKYVVDCMYSPFTKITYILTLPAPHPQFLRAVWGAVLWAVVLIFPHIELIKLTTLPLCIFFKSRALCCPRRRGPEGTSLLCLNSMGNQSLGISRGSLRLFVSLESPDESGESSLVWWISHIGWWSRVLFGGEAGTYPIPVERDGGLKDTRTYSPSGKILGWGSIERYQGNTYPVERHCGVWLKYTKAA